MYRVYFIYPMTSQQFDGEGLKKYVKWVQERLGDDCLGAGCGLADLAETQPIFGNAYKGLAYFDFVGRLEAFDAFDRKDFVEILDKMLDFTDTPPELQGVFVD
ncbi:MAG: hypothetical protein HUJ66_01885 [Oscillospiraceae bacterium]|nr:hypothetical protein [Oscillospiraceae bacterium]